VIYPYTFHIHLQI